MALSQGTKLLNLDISEIAPVLQAADGWIPKGHALGGRPHPMGQEVVQRVRPIGIFALSSSRREFSVWWSSGAMEE